MLRTLGNVDNVVKFQKFCGLSWDQSDQEFGKQFQKEHSNSNYCQEEKEPFKQNTDYKCPYKSNIFLEKLFEFGSELGNELFYIVFLPFVHWNIDDYIARRLIVLWVFTMYTGQALKDVICWPRPASPPVLRLESSYINEYGMPSTHAIAGSIIPFALVYFSYDRFNYNLVYGIIFFVLWTSLVCLSRVYRGMHTFQDLLAGLSIGGFVTSLWLPYLDISLEMFLSKPNAWIFILLIPILMIYVFPTKSMVTRNDTASIIATGSGCMLAAWTDFYIEGIPIPDPYDGGLRPLISAGIVAWTLFSASRFMIGIAILIPAKIMLKLLINNVGSKLVSSKSEISDREISTSLTIPYYFITYGCMGFIAVYVVPRAFEAVGLIL